MNWQLVQYCTDQLSIVEMLSERGYTVHENRESKIYCPFHDDVNKKSATVYPESDKIFCWTEDQLFGPYDVLHDLEDMNDEEIMEFVDYDPEEVEFDVKETVGYEEKDNIHKIKKMAVKTSPQKQAGRILNQLVNTDNILKVGS